MDLLLAQASHPAQLITQFLTYVLRANDNEKCLNILNSMACIFQ